MVWIWIMLTIFAYRTSLVIYCNLKNVRDCERCCVPRWYQHTLYSVTGIPCDCGTGIPCIICSGTGAIAQHNGGYWIFTEEHQPSPAKRTNSTLQREASRCPSKWAHTIGLKMYVTCFRSGWQLGWVITTLTSQLLIINNIHFTCFVTSTKLLAILKSKK